MAETLSSAHGTVVIDADFSAYDVNARKAAERAKDLEFVHQKINEAIDSIGRSSRKSMGELTKGANEAAAASEKVSASIKKRTRLTMEERREIELLRRETNRLKEEDRVEGSRKVQALIAANAAQLEEAKKGNRQLEREARERQRLLKQMITGGMLGGGAAVGSPVSHANQIGVPFAQFFGRYQTMASMHKQMAGGMSMSQALNAQIAAAANASNQRYLVQNAINNAAPPIFGGGAGGGRGGGFNPLGGGNFLGPGGLGSRLVGGLRGGLGMGLGVFGAVQGVRQIAELAQLATAYERQRVASEKLAGSQAQLNALLDAYNKASGGAVDNVTALSNVTRLQATGFAKSAEQVERFVRGSRGASIALGKPQDYITQETQLAISNTSVKRLDQIGLGIEEVSNKTEQLRDANKSLSREMAFGEAVLTLLNEKYGDLSDTIEGQATGLERLAKAWQDLRLQMGQSGGSSVNQGADLLAKILNGVGSFERWAGNVQLGAAELGFNAQTQFMKQAGVNLTPQQIAQRNASFILNNPGGLGWPGYNGNRGDGPGMGSPVLGPAAPRFDDAEMQNLSDFHNRRSRIEEQYNDERLREIENYESQRTSLIVNYAKQTAREEEDFFRQRARSARDYNKQVEDVYEDAARRDADLLEDYTKRVSEMREDSEDRVQELQEKYAEEREKSEKDHLDRLLSAAGQLNAIAVLEERKRYRRENEERDKAHKEQLQEARDNLDEQLEDAREAYEERLADAREADQERLRDMQEARDQQLADEDEDRGIRLARAQEDHDDQLAELDRQHGLRLKQISDEAQKERDLWETEFEQLLLDMDIYVKGLTEKEAARNKLIEDWFDKMIDKMEKDIASEEKFSRRRPQDVPEEVPAGFANGGPVRRSGSATLHRGEYVLSRGMLSGRVPVPASIAGSIMSNSRHVNVQAGAISISAVPGDSMEYLASLVEEKMIELVEMS